MVGLKAGLLKKLLANFHEIFGNGVPGDSKQPDRL